MDSKHQYGAVWTASFLLWLCFFQPLSGQISPDQANISDFNPRFELFTVPGGLLSNNVNCIVQDSVGFLWFGSYDGLHRYDGHQFTSYRHDPENPNSISFNYLEWIYVAKDGTLWLGTFGGGLNHFDPKTETAVRYRHDPNDPESLSHDHIFMITEDQAGFLWIATPYGLNRLDPQTGKFKRFFHDPDDDHSLASNMITAVYVDRRGALWIGGRTQPWTDEPLAAGLHRYEPSSESFTRYLRPFAGMPAHDNEVRRMLEDSQGNFWLAAGNNQVYLMDREKETFRPMNEEDGDIVYGPQSRNNETGRVQFFTLIMEDKRGWLWFGSVGNGINVFDPVTGGMRHFEFEENNPNQPTNNYIWQICEASDGSLWLATGGGGHQVNHLLLEESPFVFEDFREKEPDSTFGNLLDMAVGQDSICWLLFRGQGLIRYDQRTGKTDRISEILPMGRRTGRSRLFKIELAKDGKLWMLYASNDHRLRLDVFDPVTNALTSIDKEIQFVGSASVSRGRYEEFREMLIDDSGTVWLVADGAGLISYDHGSGAVRQFPKPGEKITDLSRYKMADIAMDRSGAIWVGGFSEPITTNHVNYLGRFNPVDETYQHFAIPEEYTQFFGSVKSITEGPEGKVWFLLPRVGVGVLDQASNQMEFLTPSNGKFPEGEVRSILPDYDGHLWISTINNLIHLNPKTREYQVLNAPIQGQGVVFTYAKDKNEQGDLFWGGQEGFLQLHRKERPAEKAIASRVILTELLLFDQLQKPERGGVLDKPIWETDAIELTYWDKSFTIRFACLDFRRLFPAQFQYRLDNYDSFWRQVGDAPSARYVNVPPGKYTFRLKAVNSQGIWSDEKTLQIRIFPPWWRSTAAYLIYALGLLSLIFFVRRADLQRQARKITLQEEKLAHEREINERLRKVDQLKDQFLANTSHELRTPLQGIIGLSESLYEREDEHEKQEDLSMIISSGKRLSNLVNDILDFSKLKNFDIELQQKPIDLHTLVEVVLKNNAPLVKNKPVELINAVPGKLPAALADENRLQQILYNLVGNAVKFTERGYVKVSAEEKRTPIGEKQLQIRVEDTGIGIPEDKQEDIFKEFEQGDGSAAREYAGTGLGLSISKQLAELHGGHMWVESRPEGGSSFFFTLPVASETAIALQPAATKTTLDSGAATESGRGKQRIGRTNGPAGIVPMPSNGGEDPDIIRILIVDDEPINQQVLKHHLAGKGFQLTQAMNGDEAIQAINEQPDFDLVLLDVMMPRMSGYEVCQKIREHYLTSELPVIMVTAKNQPEDIVQGLSLGANDYLPKPFHKEELLARINTQLDLNRIFKVADRFIPNEFLHALNRERITEVTLGDHTEREVTVLFADIRNYTALSESMTPEENFKFINTFHGRMGPIIQEYGGFINQYLGDGFMAIFPDSPEEALKAAIHLQGALRTYNVIRQTQNRKTLKIGVGMHTGSLIMGIIGDRKRMEATTIADTVNTASRIEGLTKHYGVGILLSGESLNNIAHKEAFHFRSMGRVQVIGKKDSLELFECFDGDAPEIAALKAETISYFEEGLHHFFNRDFPGATTAFGKVLKENPGDYPAQLLLKKSSGYLLSGVPEDWTGVEVMSFK